MAKLLKSTEEKIYNTFSYYNKEKKFFKFPAMIETSLKFKRIKINSIIDVLKKRKVY